MKAIIYERYGAPEVLRIQHIEKPVPGENEILIKVQAATVTAGDTRMRSFTVPAWQWIFARIYLGIFKPKRPVLGMELSGKIDSVGKNVKRFRVGDEVYASTLHLNFGSYAEYKCIPEAGAVALKPTNLDFKQAAAIPIGAGTALRFLRKAKIIPGQKILIYGASGSVGTYAIQIAKYFGAEVTGACSASAIPLIQSLGADHVFDYRSGSFEQYQSTFDLIFDAAGKGNRSKLKLMLKSTGTIVSVAGDPGKIDSNDLAFLKQLVESASHKPVIEKEYSMDQIVEAHRFVDAGRKKGNVIVTIGPDSTC